MDENSTAAAPRRPGRPKAAETMRRVPVQLPVKLHETIKTIADRRGIPVSEAVRQILSNRAPGQLK